MTLTLNRTIMPGEQQTVKGLIDSCGPNRGVAFPTANSVLIVLAYPGDDEDAARAIYGPMIEATLKRNGYL